MGQPGAGTELFSAVARTQGAKGRPTGVKKQCLQVEIALKASQLAASAAGCEDTPSSVQLAVKRSNVHMAQPCDY